MTRRRIFPFPFSLAGILQPLRFIFQTPEGGSLAITGRDHTQSPAGGFLLDFLTIRPHQVGLLDSEAEPGLLKKVPPRRQTCLQTGSGSQETPLEKVWLMKAGGLAGRINITVYWGQRVGGEYDNSVTRGYSREKCYRCLP